MMLLPKQMKQLFKYILEYYLFQHKLSHGIQKFKNSLKKRFIKLSLSMPKDAKKVTENRAIRC